MKGPSTFSLVNQDFSTRPTTYCRRCCHLHGTENDVGDVVGDVVGDGGGVIGDGGDVVGDGGDVVDDGGDVVVPRWCR